MRQGRFVTMKQGKVITLPIKIVDMEMERRVQIKRQL